MGGIPGSVLLGYCTNSFPGDSWADVLSHLSTEAIFIGSRTQAGVGIWLSHRAVTKLIEGAQIEKLRSLLREKGLQVFSINGFPFGNFQGPQVKSSVYFPNWSDPARLGYTLKLIQVAQELAQDGEDFSISTLPLGDRWSFNDPRMIARASGFLARAVEVLYEVEQRTGVQIHLSLEPEPLCFLETAVDVVSYFKTSLFPIAIPFLRERWGMSALQTQEVILDKVRVCYDTCHAAVLFQEPFEALKIYQIEGIRIGKVQLSSALVIDCKEGRIESGASVLDVLRPFAEDRYLHQVVGTDLRGRRVEYCDLSEALAAWEELPPSGQFRVHYHVPIHQSRFGDLGSTQDHLVKLLKIAETTWVSRYWEVETYTWSVLPSSERCSSVSEGVIREIEWVRGLL